MGCDSRSTVRRPKGAKGGSQVGPKPHLDPPEPKLAKDLLDTNLAINPVGPIFGHGLPWTNISAMASGNHQISSVSLPLNLWGILSIPSYHPYSRLQVWCIYGIIYHYAPFLLSNPMVMFSGPISTFLYQGLKVQRPFLKEDYSAHQSDKLWLQSEDSSRIPTTCICRSWVGTLFRIIQREIIKRYYINSISCQGIKYLNTPWTTQFIRTGLIQSICMA
ncbi:hypothetical protein O181_131423 [Austropuccinia psidii MF-1]|uniref:Uncharacterized protein n=1 Tax=Austropuccinia psidii MF-1 TaxID=1389203 RepID=A0A9Q3QAP8_9BASI|nr:hypothetical protein [Austropuccinia psidii MF-1]